jgi:hypothetical protein
MVLAQHVGVVDANYDSLATGQDSIRVSQVLADPSHLAAIPKSLGPWQETRSYDWDPIAQVLHANVMISRDYRQDGLLQPVNLLIVTSTNVTSFHQAAVCYQSQGWQTADNGTLKVPVPNATFEAATWPATSQIGIENTTVPAARLIATKTNATSGENEERLAVYLYLQQENWRIPQSITWVRVEAVAEPGTEDSLAPAIGTLLGAALPHLFQFQAHAEPTIAEGIVRVYGLPGAAVEILAVFLSSAPASMPLIRHFKTHGRKNPEQPGHDPAPDPTKVGSAAASGTSIDGLK